MAGAIGNLVDRIRLNGAVLDFISVGNFPVFNVADSCITVGVIFLGVGILIQDHREKKKSLEEATLKDKPGEESSG